MFETLRVDGIISRCVRRVLMKEDTARGQVDALQMSSETSNLGTAN